jgi:hypothetical protein
MSQKRSLRLREKLKKASWAEVSTRSRQALTKRWDHARYRFGMPFERAQANSNGRIQPGRFFFSTNDLAGICAELRERFPERAREIRDAAEQIRTHRFNLLGYENLDYGSQIDWHRDVVHAKRAPHKPWFKIRYLDFEEVGDSKVTWELNRHQFLVTLAKAYLLTADSRYATELFRLWYDWRQENPYPIGINWSSSLEVAFRSLSWIWVHHLLKNSPVMPQSFPDDLTEALALHGRHIEKYLSTYFSPNTHLLGEGVALFFLGTLYPGLRHANRWKTRGWEIVREQAVRQVLPDGMHFERSLHYHVYALDFFLHARILASLNQIPVPAEYDRTLVKMLEVLCTLSQGGGLPHFGDDDGGRLFDPARNRAEHLLDPLGAGAILFERGDFKAAGKLCEETLWLLGKEGMTRFDALPDTKPKSSVGLPASGIYVMSDGAAKQQVVIDAGALGTGRAGHSHADVLSLNLSIGGREFLSDPGTFSYVSAKIDRNRLRGTGAHNTLRIDDLDQAEPDGPFGWRSLPRVSVEAQQHGKTFDLVVANQSASERLPNAPLHQRTLFYLKSRFWLVRDVITGAGTHQLELFWHLPPAVGITPALSPGSFIIRRSDKPDSDGNQSLGVLMPEGQGAECRVEEDYWSPAYGKVLSSSTLRVSKNEALPSEFATLLVPIPGSAVDCGRLTRANFRKDQSALRGYAYNAADKSHLFFFNESGLEWNEGGWSSDARFFYCATSLTGELLHWIVSRGSFLARNKHPLLTQNELVEWAEWGAITGLTTSEQEIYRGFSRKARGDKAEKSPLHAMAEEINKIGNR